MVKHILPVFPTKHDLYCEPFFGGGAIFWAKEPSNIEVINDINGEVINFYEQVKSNFYQLKIMIDNTLHSRAIYEEALVIYRNPNLFDPIKRAWAFWVLSSQSFSSNMGSGWAYSKSGTKTTKRIKNKKASFTDIMCQRLENTQVECNDALVVIESRDTENSFFYIDPPYHNAHQGHYKGYRESDFIALLNLLQNIKGKFLLSSYESKLLDKYVEDNGWFKKSIEMPRSAGKVRKRKYEVLTANYDICS